MYIESIYKAQTPVHIPLNIHFDYEAPFQVKRQKTLADKIAMSIACPAHPASRSPCAGYTPSLPQIIIFCFFLFSCSASASCHRYSHPLAPRYPAPVPSQLLCTQKQTNSKFVEELVSLDVPQPLSRYAPQTYDAVWAIALALRGAEERWQNDSVQAKLDGFDYTRYDMALEFLHQFSRLNFLGVSVSVWEIFIYFYCCCCIENSTVS